MSHKNPEPWSMWLNRPFVRPVIVQTGLTDGTTTEIVKVIKGEFIEKESQLVIGEQLKGGGDKATNPFAPQPFSGRK